VDVHTGVTLRGARLPAGCSTSCPVCGQALFLSKRTVLCLCGQFLQEVECEEEEQERGWF
jgi:uncharacterized Zn finger protein (UPF0148 family)